MLQHARAWSTGIHLPLRQLALCLDCDECFALGAETCPACGSRTWTPAARFLELVAPPRAHRVNGSTRKTSSRRAEELAIVKHLLVVARHRHQLYEEIKQAFAGHESVEVILDRRVSERRRGTEMPGPDRRRGSRRSRSSVDEQLRTIGWSLVLLDVMKRKRS